MKKISLFLLIVSIGSIIVMGQKKAVHPMKPRDFDGLGMTTDFKIIAKGNYSEVEKPFLYVARNAETYQKLQGLVEELPSAETIDFTQNAIVAGFAGLRSTGGWTVLLKKTDSKFELGIAAPAKDVMVTQVESSPYKIFLIPVSEMQGLPLAITNDFSVSVLNFQTVKANFEFSGGFAGIRKEFSAEGMIGVFTHKNLVTLNFELKEAGEKGSRRLSEMASGTIDAGQIYLSRLDAGTFSNAPKPPFSVNGKLFEKQLSLIFIPHEHYIDDGFKGSGNLTAKSSPIH